MPKLKKLVLQGADADVASNLTSCAAKMRRIAAAIPIVSVDDFVGIVTQRILGYVAAEVDAAAGALRKDIKLFAWRTRNIFEGFLLLKHTFYSEQNAEVFCAQRIADEITILESMLGLNPELTGEGVNIIKERASKCREVLKKHGFGKASPWRIDKLAEATGMMDDYTAFYKLYSKYVHPSSWVIVADIDEYENHDYWEVFILNAQLYTNSCWSSAENLLISRGGAIEQLH